VASSATASHPAWPPSGSVHMVPPAAFFVFGYTTIGLMDTHLVPFAYDHGISATTTAGAVSVLAAFNIVSTLGAGFLSDRMSRARLLGMIYFVRGLSLLFLLGLHDPRMLLVFAVIFGLADFGTVPQTSSLAADFFPNAFGATLDWIFMSHQIGSSLGAYVPGLLYDLTGSYDLAFLSAFGLLMGASLLSFTLPQAGGARLAPTGAEAA